MLFKLDPDSVQLLQRLSDGFVVGIIDRNRGRVRLFEGSAVTDIGAGHCANHQDLLRAGVVRLSEAWGFSFSIAAREVQSFYRASVLNREYTEFALPSDIMAEVLTALGLRRGRHFRVYP
jgi:hypothetical protein